MSFKDFLNEKALEESRKLSVQQKKELDKFYSEHEKEFKEDYPSAILLAHENEYDRISKMNPHENFDSEVDRYIGDKITAKKNESVKDGATYDQMRGETKVNEDTNTDFGNISAAVIGAIDASKVQVNSQLLNDLLTTLKTHYKVS